MDIRQITANEALPVRHRVLWPDQPVTFSRVEGDDEAVHYGAYLDKQLVCVASLYLSGRSARLRKFATLPEFQGRGIGSHVIEHVIVRLKQVSIEYFWCDARTTAVGFYKRFGLTVEGDKFEKSGLSYYKMSVRW